MNVNDFKKDLKAVLKKHNAYLSYEASSCSDFHGISDQRLSVIDNTNNKEHRLVNESYVDATDL